MPIEDRIDELTRDRYWAGVHRARAEHEESRTPAGRHLLREALARLESGIKQWMLEGKLGKVTDEQAREWIEGDVLVWAVVVSPWLLVQYSGHLQ